MRTLTRSQRYYQRMREEGRCFACRGPASPFVYCEPCRLERRSENRKYYALLRELGLCVICKEVAKVGTAMCRRCRLNHNSWQLECRRRKRNGKLQT